MYEGKIRVSTDRLNRLAERFSDDVRSLRFFHDDLKSISEEDLLNKAEAFEELEACMTDLEKLDRILKKSAEIYEEGERQIRNLLSEL